MSAKKFEYFEVSQGRYCLVPENLMPAFIGATELSEFLNLDASVKSLSFLVKFYRCRFDLSRIDLAEKAQLSRHTIKKIEDDPKHHVDLETVKALSIYFSILLKNDSFKNAVISLGYKI